MGTTFEWAVYIDDDQRPWAIRASRSTCLLNGQNGTLSPSWTVAPKNLTPRSVIARAKNGSKISIICMNSKKFPWEPIGYSFNWQGTTYQICAVQQENIFGTLQMRF